MDGIVWGKFSKFPHFLCFSLRASLMQLHCNASDLRSNKHLQMSIPLQYLLPQILPLKQLLNWRLLKINTQTHQKIKSNAGKK